MIQKLLLSVLSVFFNFLPGNKPFISSGRWICFFLLAFQMSFGQSCNVVKTGDFTGSINATNWSSQTDVTGWYYSAAWAPNEAYIEADGITNASLKQSLTGLIAGPLTLSFNIKGQNANRVSTCNTTATLLVKLGGVTYLTVTNQGNNSNIPLSDVVVSNGASIASTTGFPLTVVGLSTAITQGTIVLTIPWSPATAAATMADLEFVATTSNLAVGACVGAWGGDDWFLDNISLIAANPTSFNMTGTSVCAGSTATIGLNGSQLGVNYQLQIGGLNTGAVVPGTGSAISFGNQTATGVYTVVATAGSTTCTTTMAGSVSISPNLPASVSIAASPAGAICYGTSVTFTATPTNGGTTPIYQWKLNGANVGTNSATYTNATLLNSDVVTCVMTSNAACLTGSSTATSNVITMSSGGPTATGVAICAGGSGSLTSSYSCASSTSTQTASGSGGTSNTTTYGGSGNTNISINFPALPVGAVVTNVSTTITYTSNAPSWTNELRIEATPPVSLGGVQNNLQVSTSSSAAGTITNTAFGTWGTGSPVGTWLFRFRETTDDGGVNPDANISNISITVAYTIPGTLDWYTNTTGGTKIGSGSPFNPVGVANSGLANTNTAGTTTYYLECSSNPGCRTPVTFVINASPSITAISSPAALCSGGSLNPSAPTVTANGSTVTASGWQLETTVGGGTYANLTVPYTVSFADNGKRIRYYATNGCGTTNSNAVAITINNVPAIAAISSPAALCSGGSLNPSAPTVTANGSTVTASGWQLETTVGGGTYANLTVPYTVAFADNGKRIRYYATNGCGTTNSNAAAITINDVPAIAAISSPAALCSGGSLNPSAPTVTANGSTVTASGWQMETTVGGGSYANLTVPYTVSFADNGKRIRYYATNGCGTTNSNAAAITINDVPAIAAISSPAALCSGGSLNPSAPTVTANGSTVTASGWQLETTVGGGTYANLTVPYTVAFADNGKRIRYYATNGCGTTNSNAAAITVNQTPSVPTVGTITNVSCSAGGSVVLNGLPSGSWTINQSGTAITSYSSNTSSYTVLGLAVGSYTFTVTNASGCFSSATGPVSITDASSTTWNGIAWSNGTPDATKNAIIVSVTPNSPFTADLSACALTINNSSGVATVPSGITLTITNGITVATDYNLIFENNASLVQINNNATNTGKIIYKRNSAPMKNFDYTYWSSPVAGQTLFDLSPNTLADKYMSYSGTGWQISYGGTAVMQPGIGYIIRTPKGGTWLAPHPEVVAFPYSQPVQFKGVPNNGNITSSQSLLNGKFYLIGNPYPSALNADNFLFTNTNNHTVLSGTIYLWTHNTAVANLKYTSDDYATYNGLGGVATSGGAVPSGYIAAGQSFFASAKANGNAAFDNSMRPTGNNTQFFKPGKTAKTTGIEKHRLWLNMTNTGGAFKQTLIGYAEGATNTYDDDFDGLTFDGNSYLDLYSINGTDNLTIQGRALPFMDTDVVPLGYRSTVAGSFTIGINQADGVLANQRIYLEDKQTGTINELTAQNYTFNTTAGTFNNRFVLRYTNKTLGTGDFETVENSITVVSQDKTIMISSPAENIDKVFIYDVSGKLLYEKQNIGNVELSIQHLAFAQQVLLVKVVLENGYTTTKKLIFK